MFDLEQRKMHSDNRILTIRQRPGDKPKDTAGLVDYRLFKGGNGLHAIRNPMNSLWSLRYTQGILPAPLRQQFTNFAELYKFTADYFGKRGLIITEITDHYAENE